MFQFNYTAHATPYAITVSMVTIILNCEFYSWRGVFDTVGMCSSLWYSRDIPISDISYM